jgi:hypothetical protein
MCAWQNGTGKYFLYGFDLLICLPRSIFILLFLQERKKTRPSIILQSFLTQNIWVKEFFAWKVRIKVMQF